MAATAELPPELWAAIFEYCDTIELTHLAPVCKAWAELVAWELAARVRATPIGTFLSGGGLSEGSGAYEYWAEGLALLGSGTAVKSYWFSKGHDCDSDGHDESVSFAITGSWLPWLPGVGRLGSVLRNELALALGPVYPKGFTMPSADGHADGPADAPAVARGAHAWSGSGSGSGSGSDSDSDSDGVLLMPGGGSSSYTGEMDYIRPQYDPTFRDGPVITPLRVGDPRSGLYSGSRWRTARALELPPSLAKLTILFCVDTPDPLGSVPPPSIARMYPSAALARIVGALPIASLSVPENLVWVTPAPDGSLSTLAHIAPLHEGDMAYYS